MAAVINWVPLSVSLVDTVDFLPSPGAWKLPCTRDGGGLVKGDTNGRLAINLSAFCDTCT